MNSFFCFCQYIWVEKPRSWLWWSRVCPNAALMLFLFYFLLKRLRKKTKIIFRVLLTWNNMQVTIFITPLNLNLLLLAQGCLLYGETKFLSSWKKMTSSARYSQFRCSSVPPYMRSKDPEVSVLDRVIDYRHDKGVKAWSNENKRRRELTTVRTFTFVCRLFSSVFIKVFVSAVPSLSLQYRYNAHQAGDETDKEKN